MRFSLCISLLFLLSFFGCGKERPASGDSGLMAATAPPALVSLANHASSSPDLAAVCEIPDFKENRKVYEQDHIKPLELTVTLFEKDGATLEDVDRDSNFTDELEPMVRVLFQEGEFGQGRSSPNAIMKQRGHSSRQSSQKSYQIRLSEKGVQWRNQRVIHLNKHPFDLTRLRNKLAFELFQDLPHLGSLRTRFVHLTIKKNAVDPGKDYGLFTQIEHRGRRYLEHHGLDPEGNLYSAEEFMFLRYPRQLMLSSSQKYKKEEFERILGIRSGTDHSKLLAMLDDVNNESLPIDMVIRKHFNRNNYLTWFAANILLGNMDTISQNFSLYSPSSGGWYFLPWDYDNALGFSEQPDQVVIARPPPRTSEGIANWWGVKLHRRFLSVPANIDALRSRVEELGKNELSPQRIKAVVTRLREVVRPFLGTSPDVDFLPSMRLATVRGSKVPGCLAEFDAECDRLPGVIETNLVTFQTTLSRPMPFHLGEVVSLENGTQKAFRWTPTATLIGDRVTYDVQIATSPHFEGTAPVFEALHLTAEQVHEPLSAVAQVVVPSKTLPPGQLFWRVIARSVSNPAENWQYSYATYVDASRVHHGVKAFSNPD